MPNPLVRTLLTAAICLVVAPAALRALTASASVPPAYAGAGEAVVSGYTVSATRYVFSADGQSIVGVGFVLDHAARDVRVSLAQSWQACGASSGTEPYVVTC